MASDQSLIKKIQVFKSDDLYLITRGDQGQVVDPVSGSFGKTNLQSIIAHCNVSEPWAPVSDTSKLPPKVKSVADSWNR